MLLYLSEAFHYCFMRVADAEDNGEVEWGEHGQR